MNLPSLQKPIQRLWNHGLEIAAGLMLVAIVAVVLIGVIARYFLQIGFGWTEEAARFLLIWMTFLGAAAAVRRWSHFRLGLLITSMPRKLHRPIDVSAVCVVLIMGFVLLRYGIAIARVSWEQTSPMLDWNMGYVYLVLPITGGAIVLFCAQHLITIWRGGALPGAGTHTGDPDVRSPSHGFE